MVQVPGSGLAGDSEAGLPGLSLCPPYPVGHLTLLLPQPLPLEAQFLGKLGLGPGPGIGWLGGCGREARRPGRVGGRRREQAPGEGRELRLLAFLSPHTLRTSSLKIHLQMNVSLNKIKP